MDSNVNVSVVISYSEIRKLFFVNEELAFLLFIGMEVLRFHAAFINIEVIKFC